MDDIQEKIKKAEEKIIEKEEIAAESALKSKKKKKRNKYLFPVIVLIIFIVSCFYHYFTVKKLYQPLHTPGKEPIEDIFVHCDQIHIKLEQYKKKHGNYPQILTNDINVKDVNLEYLLNFDNSYTFKYQSNDTIYIYFSSESPGRF